MKKLLLIIACLLTLSLNVSDKSVQGSVSIGTPDPMMRACATGNFRATSTFCMSTNTSISLDTLTITNVCTALDYTGGPNNWPTNAKLGRLFFLPSIGTRNATGSNSLIMSWYTDNACANAAYAGPWPLTMSSREEVAGGAGVNLSQHAFTLDIPTDGSTGKMYYRATHSNCGTCSLYVAPLGYYD